MRVYRLHQGIDSTCIFYSSVEEGGASRLYEYGLFLRRKYRSLVRQKKRREERGIQRGIYLLAPCRSSEQEQEKGGRWEGRGRGQKKALRSSFTPPYLKVYHDTSHASYACMHTFFAFLLINKRAVFVLFSSLITHARLILHQFL